MGGGGGWSYTIFYPTFTPYIMELIYKLFPHGGNSL